MNLRTLAITSERKFQKVGFLEENRIRPTSGPHIRSIIEVVVIHEGHEPEEALELPLRPALKPQGTKNKRTPQSFADGAAGKDVYDYEPEKVVAQRHREGRGVTQFQVFSGLRCRQDVWRPL